MVNCYQCGKETEPRFPGALRSLCPECAARAAANSMTAPTATPALTPTSTTDVAPVTAPPATPELFSAETSAHPTVTYTLVGVTCAIFVLMTATGVSPISPESGQVLDWGANFGLLTLGGQWWRLFTSMFLHFGILHLALNMWCLWSLGILAEKVMSRASFLVLYLFSGLGGSILSLAWHPMVVSAGASGAIFGIAGGLGALFYLKNVPMPQMAVKRTQGSIASFVLYNLVYGFRPGIDMAAHLGGLATGLVLGAALQERQGTSRLRVLQVPAIATVAVVLVGGAALAARAQAPIADLGVAERLLDSGQPEKAAELLEKVVAEKPDLAAAHYLLGNAYLNSEKNEKAEAEYVKAVGLDNENLAYKINLGVAYLRMEQPNPALAQFREVLSKDPENHSAQFNVAIAYNELKDYDKSLAAIDKALAIKADDPKSYWLKGEAYLGKKDAGQAIAAFQKALSLDGKFASAQSGLCRAYWQQNNLEQAKGCYQKYVEQHPNDEAARKNLDLITQSSGRSGGTRSQAQSPAKP